MKLSFLITIFSFLAAATTASLISILEELSGSRILAFGDSLTHGMCVGEGHAISHHPYAIHLREIINAEHPHRDDPKHIAVIESGISGEFLHHMETRLPEEMSRVRPRLVVILGGTNDLARLSPSELMASLKVLHKIALLSELNSTVAVAEKSPAVDLPRYSVAITLPQLSWNINQTIRLEYNNKIRQFTKICSSRVKLLDLESSFDQADRSNLKYWSTDLAHFSPLGYDSIAELIYGVLKGFQVESSAADSAVSTGTGKGKISKECIDFLNS